MSLQKDKSPIASIDVKFTGAGGKKHTVSFDVEITQKESEELEETFVLAGVHSLLLDRVRAKTRANLEGIHDKLER